MSFKSRSFLWQSSISQALTSFIWYYRLFICKVLPLPYDSEISVKPFLNSYQYIHISTFVWTALCIIFSYLATKISAPNTLFAVIECAKYSQVGGGSSNIKASVVKWVNHNSDIESIWGTLVNTIVMVVQYTLILMILFFLTNKTCKRSGSHLEDQAYICPCRWYLQAENMSIGHHYLSHVSVSFTRASFVFWDGICSIVLHCNYYEKHDPAWKPLCFCCCHEWFFLSKDFSSSFSLLISLLD